MNSSLALHVQTPAAEARVQQIIDAATTVLGNQGYAATSMKDIAQEAGVAQGLIHYYFGAKDDLVVAVLKQHCERMMEESRRAFHDATGSPLARTWAVLEAARERTASNPVMFRLFFELLPLSFTNPAIKAELGEMYGRLTDVTIEIIEELDKVLPCPLPIDRKEFAQVIVASIDGIALRAAADAGADIDAMFRALSFVLISTICASYAAAGQAVPLEDVMQQLVDAMPEPVPGA